MMIGAPAVPMPEERSAAIGRLVATVPEIVEAHLPQCYIPGQTSKSAQILFLVFARAISPAALQTIGAGLPAIVPAGEFLDILPITLASDLLETVRGTDCPVYARPRAAPWWRFRKRTG
jgi:hypothetical protein